MAKKTTEKPIRDIGNIQVKSATAQLFKELGGTYAKNESLGTVTNDQFLSKLLQNWEHQQEARNNEIEWIYSMVSDDFKKDLRNLYAIRGKSRGLSFAQYDHPDQEPK